MDICIDAVRGAYISPKLDPPPLPFLQGIFFRGRFSKVFSYLVENCECWRNNNGFFWGFFKIIGNRLDLYYRVVRFKFRSRLSHAIQGCYAE